MSKDGALPPSRTSQTSKPLVKLKKSQTSISRRSALISHRTCLVDEYIGFDQEREIRQFIDTVPVVPKLPKMPDISKYLNRGKTANKNKTISDRNTIIKNYM